MKDKNTQNREYKQKIMRLFIADQQHGGKLEKKQNTIFFHKLNDYHFLLKCLQYNNHFYISSFDY